MQNLHTHTRLCKHAVGMPEDYCRAAIKIGMKRIGFSDHTPLPDGLQSHVRMERAQLPLYVESVRTARAKFPRLSVHLGMECDYAPEYERFYRDVLLGECGIEYLVGSVHYFSCQGQFRWFDGQPLRAEEYASSLFVDITFIEIYQFA